MAVELRHIETLPENVTACTWCPYLHDSKSCAPAPCDRRAKAEGKLASHKYYLVDTLKFITWRLKQNNS